MGRRLDVPAAVIRTGRHSNVSIYGDQATYGSQTVELIGDLEQLRCLRPEDAEKLADGLKLAARMARGEAIPTALDQFLQRGAVFAGAIAPARCPDCGADVPTIFEHIDGCPGEGEARERK